MSFVYAIVNVHPTAETKNGSSSCFSTSCYILQKEKSLSKRLLYILLVHVVIASSVFDRFFFVLHVVKVNNQIPFSHGTIHSIKVFFSCQEIFLLISKRGYFSVFFCDASLFISATNSLKIVSNLKNGGWPSAERTFIRAMMIASFCTSML